MLIVLKRRNSEYRKIQDELKSAQEAGVSIKELDNDLLFFLDERLTGTFIVLAVLGVILVLLHLLGETAAFRKLLFATAWKGIDAWGRPYFQTSINYRFKRLWARAD